MADAPNFPTLGFLAADWVQAHCLVPGGPMMGQPLVHQGWQLWCDVHHYRVKGSAVFNPDHPVLGPAFFYRRSIVVGPQKTGKSPWGASLKLFEAAGPCLFGGWARGGEVYRCSEHGCDCGFEFWYQPGDAMGMCRPKSWIQLLATSVDQVNNVYLPMQDMVRSGPLAEQMQVLEDRIKTRNGGRIEPVTSSAKSRLGAPINDALADESGIYTARNGMVETWGTMRRGLAGMGGRALEITNPWDPMENSAAQRGVNSHVKDIFTFYRRPPANLSYRNKADRRKIHEFVYRGSPWVDVDAIDAEAAEMMETDPTKAMRFFGNLLVQGLGAFMPEELWDRQTDEGREIPESGPVCGGMDGSQNNDWTAIRLETSDGFRFTPTYGPDRRPAIWDPVQWGGEIPRAEVRVAMAEIQHRYKVRRFYCDPHFWETQIDDWALEFGDDVVVPWPTDRLNRIYPALTRYITDLHQRTTTHDADPFAREHALNARKLAKPGDKYMLGKPSEHQKIDILMSDVLAHEAASDARADGWADETTDNAMWVW